MYKCVHHSIFERKKFKLKVLKVQILIYARYCNVICMLSLCQISQYETVVCAQNGGPEIYVWDIAERALLHIVNPSELVAPPKDTSVVYYHNYYLTDSGRHIVLVLDVPKDSKPDTTKMGIFNVESGK